MSEDLSKKKELADAANELLENKAFTQAILQLRKRLLDNLLQPHSTEEILQLRATMIALAAIPTELTVIMGDFKMALTRQRQHG